MSALTFMPREPDAPSRRTTRARVLWMLIGGVLAAVLLTWLLPWALGTTWAHVWEEVSGERLPWALALAVCAALSLAIDSAAFRRALGTGAPGRTFWINPAAQAVQTAVPFGSTISMWVLWKGLRGIGLSARKIGAGITLASLADLLSLALVPALGLVCVAIDPPRGSIFTRVAAALTAIALVALAAAAVQVLRSERVFTALATRLHEVSAAFSEGYGSKTRDVKGEAQILRTTALEDSRDPLWLTLLMPTLARCVLAAGFVLWCSVGMKLPVSGWELIAAFALGWILTFVPLTPAGLGVTDAGVAWMLTLAGASAAQALAASLVFTAVQAAVVVTIGACCVPGVVRSKTWDR